MEHRPFQVNEDILFFAFRYALGRKSYAPISVMENIRANIDRITIGDLQSYIHEIDACRDYGMEADKQQWLSFKDYLESVLQARKESNGNQ